MTVMFFNFAFVDGGLILTGSSGLLVAKQLRLESWVSCLETEATIRSASVCPTDQDNCSHVGYVIYAYQIDDQDYTGIYVKLFSTRQDALQFANNCDVETLTVKYRPERPAESYLFVDSDCMSEGDAVRVLSAGSAWS